MHELAPAYWQCELLRWVACALYQRLASSTLVTVTAPILRAQCNHGVFDDEVVFKALALCQVGADMLARCWCGGLLQTRMLLQQVGKH